MLLSELLDIRLDLIRLISPGGTLICSGLVGKQEEELRNSLTEMGFVYRASSERETGIRFSFNVLEKKADVIKYLRQSGLIVYCLFISLLVLSNSFAFSRKSSTKDPPMGAS